MASAITAHARTACHGKAVFSAAHASQPCLMFGASVAMQHATGRSAHAQSGCLPFGSLLTNQRRQSATRHRKMVACPAAVNRQHVLRHLSACHHQVGRASFGARRVESASQRFTIIRQNLWQPIQGSAVMHRPNINSHGQSGLLPSSVPSLGSLTGRSSRHQRAAHVGAAYLVR